MKPIRIAVVLLIAIPLFVTVNSLILCRTWDDILRELEEIDLSGEDTVTDADREEIARLHNYYLRKEHYISLTVSHEDLRGVEEAFSELHGAADASDVNAYRIAHRRLCDALRTLCHLCGVSPLSLF